MGLLRIDRKMNEGKILSDIMDKINSEAKKEQVSVPYYLSKLLVKDFDSFSDVCSYLYMLDITNSDMFTTDNINDSFYDIRNACEEKAEEYLGETVTAIYRDILLHKKANDHCFDNKNDYVYHLFAAIVPISIYTTSSIIATAYIMRYYSMESIICTTASANANLVRLRNIIRLYNGQVYPWVYCENYGDRANPDLVSILSDKEKEELNKTIDKEMNTHIMYWKKFISGLVGNQYSYCVKIIQDNINMETVKYGNGGI